ncbi:MAG TPA: glycosyltransferase [Stenotrophomonas sp.]|nr:glycosyltransferase [Stenotrophomonas sp.]
MRIALDLQACQTASRHRGIGRYTLDFTRALLANPEGMEFLVGLDGTYAEEADEVAAALESQLPRAAFSRYFYPGPVQPHGHPADSLRPAADALVANHYAGMSADLVHANSLFEGFAERASGVRGLASVPGAISSVTLYDFIPTVFAEQYLAEPQYRAWYMSRLQALQRFDVMLCISEATRQDAMRLLGIPAERMAVIHAGVGVEFKPATADPAKRSALLRRLGIDDRFVLYTGNGDFRKNLSGAIEAFARVPKADRGNVQLVLNQVADESALRECCLKHGLTAKDLVITGKVSDADLIGLFQACEVFFFPSRYEGFGLPVLEAMACGAPTIAADNSSLGEVVARKDAMFKVAEPEAAAALLGRALKDEDYRADLREYGLRRAGEFSWDRTATLAIGAWRDARERKLRLERGPRLGMRKRPRIAMVTPLPPQRTGIADYVDGLLAPLSRYVDLDLFTDADPAQLDAYRLKFRLHRWQALPELESRYDGVVYQFGNSPFHAYMTRLLEQVPGTVVLHDVFLSSLFWYLERHAGQQGAFRDALYYSHGRGGLAVLEEQGELDARKRYPASLRIIEQATALIVHSAHSLEVIEHYFPGSRRPSVSIAPMPLRLPVESMGERGPVRTRLGIDPEEFLLVSFGFLAETKLNHLLLDAMAELPPAVQQKIRVVFVGENESGDYGQAIRRRVQELKGRVRVEITGFANDSLYRDYLVAADLAVQLRAGSRGETSKAVYDCLAHALPTVVNDYAGFSELPSQAVRTVEGNPTPESLASALLRLFEDPAARRLLGSYGREYIRSHHDPDITARAYVVALEDAQVQGEWRDGSLVVNRLADVLVSAGTSPREMDALEHALQLAAQRRGTPRLLLDLSEVVSADYGTGIHRVVRNMARECLLAEHPTQMKVEVVAHDKQGQFCSADDYAVSMFGVPAGRDATSLQIGGGDLLMLLDSAWDALERFDQSIEQVRAYGGRVGAMVYDLIPVRYPQYCVEYMPAVFERWLRYVVKHCDFLVCISKAVADDLKSWIEETGAERRPLQRIGHVHLGSDLVEQVRGPRSERLRAALEGETVLMVGTVEPRKGHDIAVDAFEKAWQAGSDKRLVIVGKEGWNVAEIALRLRKHPELGRRLFWFEHTDDEELRQLYGTAVALLQASHAEGFGLPIVEAARYGVPLLLSDIPVFREIAADHAAYFPVGDSAALSRLLLTDLPPAPPRDLGCTWKESANALLRIIDRGPWDY